MSELGETFSAYRELRRAKKEQNKVNSIEILKNAGISYQTKNGGIHLIVGEYNFWPTTGKFQNRITKKTGRGVFKLIKLLTERMEGE